MKRFNFRLETVLKYRRQLEEIAMADFQRALAEEKGVEAKLREQQQSLREACDIGFDKELNIDRHRLDEYKHQMAELIKAQLIMLTVYQQKTQHKRGEYLECRKETRILERLRERAMQDHHKENDKMEQREMDDLFLMKLYQKGESQWQK